MHTYYINMPYKVRIMQVHFYLMNSKTDLEQWI